ncbi:MAG TPA: acyl-CoA dehydrogenase family protein, partial [Gemmatimonadaceae bacterium]
MPDARTLAWPFFDDAHRALAADLHRWAHRELAALPEHDVDATCRTLVRRLGDAGWLRHTVPAAYGGAHARPDLRTLCLARETLAEASGLADFTFAMQGLGAGPIALFGSDELQARYLPRVAAGEAIAAFAISEAAAGSDVGAMRTTAHRDGSGHFVIHGEKTWISNGGIADFYVVFCRLERDDEDDSGGYVALVVEPGDAGFTVAERIATIAPHPLATIRFDGCRVPADRVVGEPGRGMRVALGTLDLFRTTVGAAALGFARRALAEALGWALSRRLGSGTLADNAVTQEKLADMALAVDASALL